MLADFQQALADMVAEPALASAVRVDPAVLARRYALSPLEAQRLAAMARHPGMACNCMLYRANRLAPLAMNLRELCRALGPRLKPLVDAFWTLHHDTDVHFLVECERFCRFLEADDRLPPDVRPVFEHERLQVALRLAASETDRFVA